ncbi:hypothetical protein CCHR01_19188 [Colletotrichum chrysophilum]|uniref:Uncharacterized protein n=1 Tax=Colletotrichum chrysophilum TaxID=1836956 RepID=A0AAD9A338_9PEZI|nr:hypothetical protein CCHR01_19188 [Colletotrichum chrysophilum]
MATWPRPSPVLPATQRPSDPSTQKDAQIPEAMALLQVNGSRSAPGREGEGEPTACCAGLESWSWDPSVSVIFGLYYGKVLCRNWAPQRTMGDDWARRLRNQATAPHSAQSPISAEDPPQTRREAPKLQRAPGHPQVPSTCDLGQSEPVYHHHYLPPTYPYLRPTTTASHLHCIALHCTALLHAPLSRCPAVSGTQPPNNDLHHHHHRRGDIDDQLV